MATVNELLNMPGSTKQISAETRNLIQLLRERMRQAQAEDRAKAENLRSAGKAGLKGIKTRKDYLLAKRANPELSFKDFLLNDKASAEYMRQGAEMVVNKDVPGINFKEIFGFAKDRHLTEQALKNKIAPYTGISEEEFIPEDVNVPEFDADAEIENMIGNQAKPRYSTKEIMEGVKVPKTLQEMKIDHISKYGELPESPIIGYNKPENLEFLTRNNPQMLEEVVVTPSSATGSASTATGAATGATSTAGKILESSKETLGTAGAALGVGSSLKDLGTKGLTPATAADSAGSALLATAKMAPPTAPVTAPLCAILKFLGGGFSRSKYNA